MKKIRIGLAGFGTVGFGTYETLTENAELFRKHTGCDIEIARVVVRNVEKAKEKVPEATFPITSNIEDLTADASIDIVVEVMGGIGVAKTLIEKALEAGKHVVTANKYLLATFGNELFAKAQAHGVQIFYEASVAGGIPIIKALREGLTANPVLRVAGIVNGTCNYILTTMREEGRDFALVLKDAQKLGYAEADPTFDIEGIDASHKLALLCAIAFGTPVNHGMIACKGITSVTSADIACAEAKGYRIKLIAYGARTENGLMTTVRPMFVSKKLMLAGVEGAVNAVNVQSIGLGETLYVGRGAGARPTASAVVADIVDCVRGSRVPALSVCPEQLEPIASVSPENAQIRHALTAPVTELSEIVSRLSDTGLLLETDTVAGAALCLTGAVSSAQLQSILGADLYKGLNDYPILEANE